MASVKCEARAGLERSSSVTKGPQVAHINAASLSIGLQISVKMFVNPHPPAVNKILPSSVFTALSRQRVLQQQLPSVQCHRGNQ